MRQRRLRSTLSRFSELPGLVRFPVVAKVLALAEGLRSQWVVRRRPAGLLGAGWQVPVGVEARSRFDCWLRTGKRQWVGV